VDTKGRCSEMFVISMIASLPAFSALLLQNEDDLDAVTLVEAALESEDALDASARTKCPRGARVDYFSRVVMKCNVCSKKD
jgi:hypothetical protein